MKNSGFSAGQTNSLLLLRILIGWHFLYEGVLKMYNPAWTSKGYLLSASFMKPFFIWLSGPSLIGVVDTLNIVGLAVVGLGLLLGIRIRWASIVGILLLAMYYLAHPPFPGFEQGATEGSYWLVNKNLIEIAALWAIYQFTAAYGFGVESFFTKNKVENTEAPAKG